MAQTAIVNPRRRRRRRKNEPLQNPRKRRRRRAYGSMAQPARRRRRRRNPDMADLGRRTYKRRTYARKNPDGMTSGDFGAVLEVLPAATAGVLGARWAVKMAGDFEDGKPGFKHALALWLAAIWGSPLLGNLFGDNAKGKMAAISCLGFGGDLFARKHWLEDSDIGKNLYLGEGADDDDEELSAEDMELLQGLTEGSAIADFGARSRARKFRPFIGADPQLYVTPGGDVVQLSGAEIGAMTPEHRQILADAGYSGLTEGSAIAGYGSPRQRRASGASSFGYIAE